MADQPVKTPLVLLGNRSSIHCESKGVILILSPWNFPFNLSLIPLVSAIAAGNTVLLKPSEFSPASSQLMVEIIHAVFEPHHARVVTGDAELASYLTTVPFDHIFFTGSTNIGAKVMAAAAPNLTPITLELGGKSPVVVDPTASLKAAAKAIVWGRFFNTGQTCVAPDYCLVHASIKDQLVESLKQTIREYYSSRPDESDDYGAVISERQFEHVHSLLEDARHKGSAEIHGGEVDASRRHISPTLVVNPVEGARLHQEEVFGPILMIQEYQSIEEAAHIINNKSRPLSMYMFSKSKKNIKYIQEHTRSGSFTVNEAIIQFNNPHLPFGGIGASGFGRGHGHAGFLEFTNQRSIMRKTWPINTSFVVYPPYTKFKKRIAEIVLKWL